MSSASVYLKALPNAFEFIREEIVVPADRAFI
jgi:hypothetical protein